MKSTELLERLGSEDTPLDEIHWTPLSPQDSIGLARRLRIDALNMVRKANASHIGSCLSLADILAVLYSDVLRHDPANPNWEERDRFILSKGHAAAIAYAVLAECGYFPLSWLETYCQDGSKLTGHITRSGIPGVEFSAGSLGHGLPVGCGIALAAKRGGLPFRTFVVLSDGELDEGSNWEAILFAPHHQLDNLCIIVDYNKIQSFGSVEDVLDLHPLAEKFESFRWNVRDIDGHDHEAIRRALTEPSTESGRPTVVIANTVKGKGVSYMENELLWHYRFPKGEEFDRAMAELEGCERS